MGGREVRRYGEGLKGRYGGREAWGKGRKGGEEVRRKARWIGWKGGCEDGREGRTGGREARRQKAGMEDREAERQGGK